MGEQSQVVVNDELVLNASCWEEIDGSPSQRLVHSPAPTLFDLVLDYLDKVARDLPDMYYGFNLSDEAIAAIAVCLRLGSYLAVRLDRDEPICGDTNIGIQR